MFECPKVFERGRSPSLVLEVLVRKSGPSFMADSILSRTLSAIWKSLSIVSILTLGKTSFLSNGYLACGKAPAKRRM